MKKIKLVHLSVEKQIELGKIFASKRTGKPLAQSTVSNYMNSNKYPQHKYSEMRDFAVKYLGGKWYEKTIDF